METTSQSTSINRLAKTTIWYNRIVIALVTLLFIFIGLRNCIHPAESAKAAGLIIETANGMSVARVSMGAFPMGFAFILFIYLFSTDTLLMGICSVFVMIIVITTIRIIGYTIDGAAPFIGPEIVVTVLSGIGLFMEMRRRNIIPLN